MNLVQMKIPKPFWAICFSRKTDQTTTEKIQFQGWRWSCFLWSTYNTLMMRQTGHLPLINKTHSNSKLTPFQVQLSCMKAETELSIEYYEDQDRNRSFQEYEDRHRSFRGKQKHNGQQNQSLLRKQLIKRNSHWRFKSDDSDLNF